MRMASQNLGAQAGAKVTRMPNIPAPIAFPGLSSPGASTEAPLEMLSACHGRIDTQCATLERLLVHLAAYGVDAEARTAARNVLRYFDTAAVDHHADEETDLFPALLESMAGSDPVCLREMTAGLIAEHRQLEQRWAIVRAALQAIIAGTSAQLAAAEVAAVHALVQLYRHHLEREERELLPMAARLLGDAELAAIGAAMRRRRGIGDVDFVQKPD